MIILKKR